MTDTVDPESPSPVSDTVDPRLGAPLDDAALVLLPLLGVWQGSGALLDPGTGEQRPYVQAVTVAHDGRPLFVYESRTWLLDDEGNVGTPDRRECGFWRVGHGTDDVELAITTAAGEALLFAGREQDGRFDVATVATASLPSADTPDAAERRLYAVDGDTLAYAVEVQDAQGAFNPSCNARLVRVRAADGPDQDRPRARRRFGRG